MHPSGVHLDYLIFDVTDDEAGACSFDAMASALPARLPALLGEVEAVLQWACREFGFPAAGDEGEWMFDLHALGEGDAELDIAHDCSTGRVSLPHVPGGRITLTLTLSGSKAFGDAFAEAFSASG